jgi:hypothetical protein
MRIIYQIKGKKSLKFSTTMTFPLSISFFGLKFFLAFISTELTEFN